MQCSVCNKNPSLKKLQTPKGEVSICGECLGRLEAMKEQKHLTVRLSRDPSTKNLTIIPRLSKTSANSIIKRSGLPAPSEIRAHLDEYVIGQFDAKKVLSVAVYNHYKRVNYTNSDDNNERVELGKSNVLMLGPTGSGKTLVARTLARALDVPFASADATSLLSGGGRGLEEKVIIPLAQACNYDSKKAERGIIYIDEIDKISKRGHNHALGESIQQSLLKIIEGTVSTIMVQGEKRSIQIDTSNILFIVGGAFVGIEDQVLMRFGGGASVGEVKTTNELLKEVTPSDIIKFGLIPEFVGRLPVIVTLDELDHSALIKILTEPKNALVKQYKKKFALDGIDLEFDKQSLVTIADMALKLKTGARGLRTVMEESMLDIMYNAPSETNLNRITITSDVITKSGKATFQYIEAAAATKLDELLPKRPRGKAAP
ncbi:MAG: ATP-dependent Clp protease ATP-binding subunit ClpX [Firmicutes bacterium]|nr:ATP-dependent Clp protease ATP-binding subunit ClpX [Bacillota bacterium]